MKRTTKLATFVFALMMSFCASAQLDTAWLKMDYQDYYINPQLVDPACEAYFCTDSLPCSNSPITGVKEPGGVRITSVAQRFDLIGDSLRLSGIALYANSAGWSYNTNSEYHDSIKIGLLNSSMDVIYEQIFISGGFPDGNLHYDVSNPRFIECFFDSIVTIKRYDHYYAFVQLLEYPCESNSYNKEGIRASWICFAKSHRYIDVPCGYNAKYRPLGATCISEDMWINADENWYENNNLYSLQSSACDSLIYAPAGIFPMRAAEDTTAMALAAVALGLDAVRLYPNPTKSGEITIEATENILAIEIYDIANRLVRTESANANSVCLNLAALAPGTYLAKVRTESGTATRKFIIE